MQTVMLTLAAFACVVAVGSALEMAAGNRRLRWLKNVAPPGESCGKVSIIVAARNEERHIAGGVQSLIAQTYPDLEIILVDDRSTDGTGAILDDLAKTSQRLKVVHVTDLPDGWLGKNHALQVGAGFASGRYLLFTDADVVMDGTAVGRAISYLCENKLDHLPIAPSVRGGDFWLNLLIGAFLYVFTLATKPWFARRRKSPFHMGIGAFNLITADAYRSVGGHERIALRPDDDMMLGKLVKGAGLRQEMLVGRDLIGLEWYASCGEMIRGLEKNAFAGLRYSVAFALLVCVFLLSVLVLPPITVFFTGGWARVLNLAAFAAWTVSYADQARLWKVPAWHAFFFPFGILLLVYTIVRAVAKTLITGGIRWRDHFYRLSELRKNRL
ncbi:MAG: glycosyltransferase [Phycisphaerae bacterium]|nr:glycosyltransferase [Phycisphaerae bacterium]